MIRSDVDEEMWIVIVVIFQACEWEFHVYPAYSCSEALESSHESKKHWEDVYGKTVEIDGVHQGDGFQMTIETMQLKDTSELLQMEKKWKTVTKQ